VSIPGLPAWAMPDEPPPAVPAAPVLGLARARQLAAVPVPPPLSSDWNWERYMGTGLMPGVPVTLQDGRLVMAGADGKVTTLRPRASLQVTENVLQHPGVNYDPGPAGGLEGVPLIQRMTDGGLVVYPMPTITSNAGDEGQINAALLQSLPMGAPVRLAPYTFRLQGPVVMAMSALGASALEGTCPVVGEAAGSAGAGIFGAVLTPQANFAGVGGLANSQAAVYLAPTSPNGGNKMFGPVLLNFWVDLRSASTGTWGVSAYGQVNHLVMSGVGIWGNSADTTSDNMRFDQDAGSENVNYPDGITLDMVISQAHGRYGLFANINDSLMTGVHVQGAQASTTDSGCFLFQKANNVRLIGCRADQGIYGFIFDSNPGGNPNTPGSSITMVGCGTENNLHNAVYLKNTSAVGNQSRTPVLATGCSWDFPGKDGTSAAVRVDGWNLLTMWNSNITNGGNAFPQAGMEFHGVGTGPGVPSCVVVDGGIWNPAAGGAYFINPATPTLLSYRFYGAIGAIQGGATPVNPTLQKSTTWP
jgi:hypothetical protein